ncbi:Tudor domain-containing protein 6 [Channa argus]|uniref:Tudor domain-containing protein 6 n=1 Tax=Channa argus TaxID=215402 RepID=A0A6G1QEV1_CHAAH|nr:Tudor domain-containing protein 6 [Channa argus]
MCSIPGPPTPGSEVSVVITRVNLNPSYGLVELWVNMNDGRRHIYEQLKEDIQIPERKFYRSEGKPGDLCLVWISDTWHRAEIVSIQCETYSVFLIDQGQTYVAKREALAWGSSDSFLLPPEIESCLLANVLSLEKKWPERATKFLESLAGKKFKGLVQHVLMPERTFLLDLPIVSKHMCKFGIAKNIPDDEFKCLVRKFLHLPERDMSNTYRIMQEQNLKVSCQLEKHGQYFYPELLTDTCETVIVTEVIHPNKFFCMLLIFTKAVNILSEQLHQYYKKDSDFGGVQPQSCGDSCAARGINGKWHRSLLKQNIVASDSAVEVFHVDEGTTEVVPVRHIRPLHGKFLRMPVVTYLCSLNGVKDKGTGWPTDQTDYLKSLLLNQTVVARFDHHSIPRDLYFVTVFTGNATCINDCFTEKTAVPQPFKAEQDSDVQNETISSSFLNSLEDEKYTYCNKVNGADKYLQDLHLQQTDQQLSNNSELAGKPNGEFLTQEHVSEPFLTKLKQENVHRGNAMSARNELMISSQSTTKVSALEFGETSEEQRQPPLDVILEDKENVLMETFIKSSHCDSEIKQLSVSSCPEGNVNVYKRPNIFQDKTEEVYASCIVEPHYFWCQYADTEDLNKLSKMAQEAGQTQHDKMFPETLNLGGPCLALYSGDNQWYRAQVVQRTGDNIHVLFVDYGNESDVDIKNVRSLPKSLLEMAPQAFLCSLNGFDESRGSWDDSVYDIFYNVLLDKALRVTVLNIEDCSEIAVPRYTVQIECENVIVNDAMQKYWKTVAKEHIIGESPQRENSQCSQTEVNPAPFDVSNEHVKNEVAQTEAFLQADQTETNMTHFSNSTGNVNTCVYRKPSISKNETIEVYASVIVEPCFFWCQYANTEDLSKVSMLAQEAGQAQQDIFPEPPGPGSPCLALFSSDNQWHRAWVTQRTGDTLHVLFVDHGNESDVNLKNVTLLPQSLLDMAPQAFLCSLNGFDESKGSWDDLVYDDFYSVLVDKPLKLTVLSMEDHSEIPLPQYAVQIECENVIINDAMQKYWKPAATKNVKTESPKRENLLQCSQNGTTLYKNPDISKGQTECVYASCIAEPSYFWCQYANTEDLTKVLTLAQEAGQAQLDIMVPETLGPGSPCLALFSNDNQWYRAQVIQRTDSALHLLFVDYGNESDVDIKNVRPLPQTLLEMAPQAFLCSLNGFDCSKGSWDDQVYDDFYNILIDKPLRVTVFNTEDNAEISVPQFAVEIECEGVVVNTLMKKYWKGQDTEQAFAEGSESVDRAETRTMEECSKPIK